jgi:hypothetical protein
MINPTFKITPVEAAHLLKGLIAIDESQITKAQLPPKSFPVIRGIQTGRIRYRRSDPTEHWQTWRELTDKMRSQPVVGADCEDLASAVVAELRHANIRSRVYVYKSAAHVYHVVVSTQRWGFLDPSRAAGMEGIG